MDDRRSDHTLKSVVLGRNDRHNNSILNVGIATIIGGIIIGIIGVIEFRIHNKHILKEMQDNE
ncbi:hypothetical protein EXS72_02935 [Candidatus Pacearchaeota archaeon]|nr:hypothetical protein [Candidatus Pacearchaeota archaeon]